MQNFQNSFFKSDNETIENLYRKGVACLKTGDLVGASDYFLEARKGGHVSATFNLYQLLGSGAISPYDFDAAAECWYLAAEAGHPTAKATLWLIEAADRGGFGSDKLADLAQKQGARSGLVAPVMICAARFFDVVCRKFGAAREVIAYELDGASYSELPSVRAFLNRAGLDPAFYSGGLDRIGEGTAADLITDGLNQFSVAMLKAGHREELVAMARCSIVGYIILKSEYGENAQQLLGTDQFFRVRRFSMPYPLPNDDDLPF